MSYRSYNQNNYYYRPGSGQAAGSNRGYGQSSRGGYEDRNWYYQPDLYDERNRYSGGGGGGGGIDRNPGYYDNRSVVMGKLSSVKDFHVVEFLDMTTGTSLTDTTIDTMSDL